jgi:hypothetical protein
MCDVPSLHFYKFNLMISKNYSVLVSCIILFHVSCKMLYLFVVLFNDAFSSSEYIASDERMIVNNELERMWKEAVMA